MGRVIEVNYKTSRVLLLSDLNSNVPVSIAPQNVQAIITGAGENYGQIKYIKDGLLDDFNEESIVYTSGTGAIFKSGIPIGKLKVLENETSKLLGVEFYSDFSQLKYVFAEIIEKTDIIENQQNSETQSKKKTTIDTKLKLLEDEIIIIEETNLKFKEENEILKSQINDLNNKIQAYQSEIVSQKKKINQFDIDKEELKFLRLNLEFGHKCRRTFFNAKGYNVGTAAYRNCILNKGIMNE